MPSANQQGMGKPRMVKPTKRTGVFAKARCRSWFLTIREQRLAIQRHLRRHPSLHTLGAEALMDGFEVGVDLALRENLLPLQVFSKACLYTFEQVLAPTFLCDPTGDIGMVLAKLKPLGILGWYLLS